MTFLTPLCNESAHSAMVNRNLLNFGKRYKDNLRVIFDQWPKLHLGLDALSNQKILKGVLYQGTTKRIEEDNRAYVLTHFDIALIVIKESFLQ